MSKFRIIMFVIILLIIYGVIDSFFIVRPNEFAVVTQFGKIVKLCDKGGLYNKIPFSIQKVSRIEKRLMVFESVPSTYILGDKNPLVLSCFVCYRIKNPLLVIKRFVTVASMKQQIEDMLVSQLGNELGNYKIDSILNTDKSKIKITEIEKFVTTNISKKAVEEYGIEILSIGIKKINYPPVVAKSVYERMKSERQIEASRYRADGQQKSASIDAETDLKVSEIIAEAMKKAEIIKGQGDKQSLELYTEVFSKDRKFFNYINLLETYKEIINSNDVLIFSMKDSIFKELFNMGNITK